MADGKEEIEKVEAKAGDVPEPAGDGASKPSRTFKSRWVRTCVTKALAPSVEKELARRRSAADKTPWKPTRRR
jgi:hypothetical protein